jgi:hypothetical protein
LELIKKEKFILCFIKQVNHDTRSRGCEISFTVPVTALLTTGYYEGGGVGVIYNVAYERLFLIGALTRQSDNYCST